LLKPDAGTRWTVAEGNFFVPCVAQRPAPVWTHQITGRRALPDGRFERLRGKVMGVRDGVDVLAGKPCTAAGWTAVAAMAFDRAKHEISVVARAVHVSVGA